MSIHLQAKLDVARVDIQCDLKYAPIVSLLWARTDYIDASKGPTACTDGTSHFWNPDFLESLPRNEVRLTKLHELGHDWLYHPGGRFQEAIKSYGAEIPNLGADHVVNNFLVDCGEKLGPDWFCDRKYQGWSLDMVCHDLSKNQKPNPCKPNSKPGQGGGHEAMENATPQQQAEAQAQAEKAMANASLMDGISKAAGLDDPSGEGQGSSAMASMLQAARDARHKAKDWRTELDEFKGELRSGEQISTYSRVCRRPIPGIIRPGKKREGEPRIGVIIDSSGSMYMDLPKIMVELEVMSDDGYAFDVICTDGEVYGPFSFDAHDFDYRSLPLKGGGGSDMVPAFEEMKALCPEVDAIIFCTDGGIDWPSEELVRSLEVPVILCEFAVQKSKEGKYFYKHLLIK